MRWMWNFHSAEFEEEKNPSGASDCYVVGTEGWV